MSTGESRPARPQGEKPLGWERLLTEGEVRGARLRRVSKVLLPVSLILTMVGGLLVFSAGRPAIQTSPQQIIAGRVSELQKSVLQPLAALSTGLRLTAEELEGTPPAEEIPDLVEIVLSGLQVDGRVPASIRAEEVDPLAFFSASWPVGRLVFVRAADEDLVAVGGIVHMSEGNGRRFARRWVGIFRRSGAEWKAYSLDFPGLFRPDEVTVVEPTDIPVSLNRLMGREPV